MEFGTMSMGVGDRPVPNINTGSGGGGGGGGGGGSSVSNMDMMNMDMGTGTGTGTGMDMGRMPMHDTFYWGKNAIVLFSGWPGDPNRNFGMYLLAIIFVFLLAFAVEILSVVQTRKISNAVTLTLVYVVRMVLVYMVMLAAMSFNMGIFIFIILGHALGFFLAKARSLVPADNSVQNLQGSPAPANIGDSKA